MSNFDLNTSNDLLKAQVKLRGSLDERMVIWWIRATQYAVVDSMLTPLYNLHNASFQKFKRINDNAWSIRMLELAYFTNLATKQPLKTFTNPFTKDSGPLPAAVFGPNYVTLTTSGLQPPEYFPYGTLTFDGQLGPGYTDDSDVWIQENTLVKMTADNPAFGNYIYNELVTYSGNLAELNKPQPTARATMTYSTTSNWRPWMMAGDTPGHIMSEGFGKKVISVDELPADYLAMAQTLNPDLIANPEKMLDATPQLPKT